MTPVVGYSTSPIDGSIETDFITGLPSVKYGQPVTINGFRLEDGRASYGVGLETFFLGFPIHFDWSWRTLFNKAYEDYVFAAAVGSGTGGSDEFRKPKFDVWIGYDF